MRNTAKPTTINISVTGRCNLRCRHCKGRDGIPLKRAPFLLFSTLYEGFSRKKIRIIGKNELSGREWTNVITSLKEWLGTCHLTITGGEPFVRKDMMDIIRFCHKSGMPASVCTNATLLTTRDIAELSSLDTVSVNISLDGSTPSTHDYIRGASGVYRKAMDVLRRFKGAARKCRVIVATLLAGYNCNEILDIVDLVHEKKMADSIIFQALDHPFVLFYDKAWFKSMLWPKGDARDKLIEVIEKLIALKESGVRIYNSIGHLRRFQEYFLDPENTIAERCRSGEHNFTVDPKGYILLCEKMASAGHFFKGPEQIWNSAAAEKRRKAIRGCRKACRLLNCNFKEN